MKVAQRKGKSLTLALDIEMEMIVKMTNEASLVIAIRYDNHSYSDVESKLLRYSPSHSPKTNSFARGKTRRSMDVSMGKGPDFEKVISSSN